MAELRELLTSKALQDIQVVAGKGGLSVEVGTVTVMEVPDVIQWLRGNDFLITSLYSIGDDEKKQTELLDSLIHSKSACVAIKTGKYAKRISKKMLQLADENNFPILQIPYEMTYIDIIMAVMNVLLTEKNTDEIIQRYFRDILYTAYVDEEMIIERGRFLGIPIQSHRYQAIYIIPDVSEKHSHGKLKSLQFAASQIAAFIRTIGGNIRCYRLNMENSVLLLVEGTDSESLRQHMPYILEEIGQYVQMKSKQNPWQVGIGSIESDAKGIRTTYRNAMQALQTGRILKPEMNIYEYEELKIYCSLREMMREHKTTFYSEIQEKVKNQEWLDTLEMYYDCGASLEEIANRLFTHKNTIKYRLSKIREATGLDVRKVDDSFKLYLMILEKKICSNREV